MQIDYMICQCHTTHPKKQFLDFLYYICIDVFSSLKECEVLSVNIKMQQVIQNSKKKEKRRRCNILAEYMALCDCVRKLKGKIKVKFKNWIMIMKCLKPELGS